MMAKPCTSRPQCDVSEEKIWCLCKKPENGWMVECCNEANCEVRWFHFDCVGLKTAPKGDWYCPRCIIE